MEIKLRELRESRGYKVSQMVSWLDVKDSRYRKWESNSAQIPLEYACMCADILGCTLDELAGRAPVKPSTITASEQHMLDVYRAASDHGRMLIDSVVSAEAQHMDSMAKGETRSA